MQRVRIGVIGGSGVYDLQELKNVEEVKLDTPFGAPSDAYVVGELDGCPVAFLARHGRGHRISPTRLNARANICGFKMLGVEYLLAANACGSLQPEYAVGDMVVPDQLFDRTRARPLSYFDDPTIGTEGVVAHLAAADPFCPYLSKVLADAVESVGRRVHRGGTFVIIEGPRFSTRAESLAFKKMGFAIVGMTTIPEAFLAREAGMSYATVAHITDYDAWHEEEAPVTTEIVVKRLLENADAARRGIARAVRALADAPLTPYAGTVKDALITRPDCVPEKARRVLEPILASPAGA